MRFLPSSEEVFMKRDYTGEVCQTDKPSVTYIVRETGQKITNEYDSVFKARNFARKLKYSRRCRLVSMSGFFMEEAW